MKGIHLRIRFVFLVLIYSSSAIANLKINTTFEYYDISPQTKFDIKPEINRLTPITNGGTKFHGSTTWQVEWSLSWKKSNEICYIDNSTTKLHVLFKMPRISPDFQVTDTVKDTFDKYSKALLNHENGHMDNGIDASREINVLLANFSSFSDCKALNEAVENSISEVIDKYKLQDIAYDEKTEHGKLQGVSIKKFI
jgi:predicted secreted Zn-dependent protease